MDRAIPRARSGPRALRPRSRDLGTGRGRVDPLKAAPHDVHPSRSALPRRTALFTVTDGLGTPPYSAAMPATARRRCAQCGNALRARDKFCASCGTPLEGAHLRPTRSTVDSASLQVRHIARAALGEQRKVVTILFADLSGSTVLGERLDPEELRGVLTSYFNELSHQIQRYEGTIDKYVGDAVMAGFRAPLSPRGAPGRAIHAAPGRQQNPGGPDK